MVVFETDSVHLALVFDRGIGIVQPDEVQGGVDKVSCACISEKLEPESVFLIAPGGSLNRMSYSDRNAFL